MPFDYSGGGLFASFSWLIAVILIGIVFWAAIYIFSKVIEKLGNGGEKKGVDAEEILKQRYAKGEISKEVYEQKIEELKK